MYYSNISRDTFMEIFQKIDTFIYNYFDDCYNIENENIKIWKYEETSYILEKDSGILITWYKHLGRSHNCNKKLTKRDYIEFSDRIIAELKGELSE